MRPAFFQFAAAVAMPVQAALAAPRFSLLAVFEPFLRSHSMTNLSASAFALRLTLGLALCGSTAAVSAFDSGSTGADGAFNPLVNTEVPLPPSGVLNYTTVTIPVGVTVTFTKNATNTPVVILASGDVTIAGQVQVNGADAPASGPAGNGQVGDDGVPGAGGPGGYDGGRGGLPSAVPAENISGVGEGPGGAGASHGYSNPTHRSCGGSGGGYGTAGAVGGGGSPCTSSSNAVAGPTYGQATLQPMIGGSGGSGGAAKTAYRAGGGGGGGGALLIAASGTLNVTGQIRANGGKGGAITGQGSGGAGGSGSGGAIRLIATTISGEGAITASGGTETGGTVDDVYGRGGAGGAGRIRLEAETITRVGNTSPAYSFGTPGPVFVAGLPTLRIVSVAGVAAPMTPTGEADIALPVDTPNPVTVILATTDVPLGNQVELIVTPPYGEAIEASSDALVGTVENAEASAQIALPTGPSVMLATVSYSVEEESQQNKALSHYTGGESVSRVELSAAANGERRTILHTRSGRRVALDPARVAIGG